MNKKKRKLMLFGIIAVLACVAVVAIIAATRPQRAEARLMPREEMAYLEKSQNPLITWKIDPQTTNRRELHYILINDASHEFLYNTLSLNLWIAHGDYWRFVEMLDGFGISAIARILHPHSYMRGQLPLMRVWIFRWLAVLPCPNRLRGGLWRKSKQNILGWE